jgi:hypothetical protein
MFDNLYERCLAAGIGGAAIYNAANTEFLWRIGAIDYVPIVLAFVIGIGLAGSMRKR